MKLCWHKWLPWGNPIDTYNEGHKAQWRVCEKCNLAQRRILGWDGITSATAVVASIKPSRESGDTK